MGIFEQIERLMEAHGDDEDLARILGVHITTLHRWVAKRVHPNAIHQAKIHEVLGTLHQGQLFHTAPGITQQEANSRFGSSPIPGLLVFSASERADPFRLGVYATVVRQPKQQTSRYGLTSDDIVTGTFCCFPKPYPKGFVGYAAQKGDIVLGRHAHGQLKSGVVINAKADLAHGDDTLLLRAKGLSPYVLARLLVHPVVLHQIMPYVTPSGFSDLFGQKLIESVVPISKEQLTHLNDWGARLASCNDEWLILGNAVEREVQRVAADWLTQQSLKGPNDN